MPTIIALWCRWATVERNVLLSFRFRVNYSGYIQETVFKWEKICCQIFQNKTAKIRSALTVKIDFRHLEKAVEWMTVDSHAHERQ